MALRREGNYMARDSLFKNRWFRRLIEYLNAFPVRRQSADIAAIKESMRRLKQGRLLLMFPEGTRTPDGRIQPLLPGMVAIAKKARVPIVPTLIDGMFQAWPRHQRLPSPGRVIVEYDRPITLAEYEDLTAEQLTELVRQRLVVMQSRWHRLRPERRLKWYQPEPGA
jgi:1-acyl-sn-glycerol-3-phosphate acyltransferase